jgi:hypothetical protein
VKPWARWSIVGATVVGLLILFVILRPDNVSDGAAPTPPTPSATASLPPTPSPTASSPSPSPVPERTLIEVTYRDGAVQGPTRFDVSRGDDVRIVVRADVTDHVHIHGYDLMADVAPGAPARIDFVADAAGVFEVELEDAGRLLFQLEISP